MGSLDLSPMARRGLTAEQLAELREAVPFGYHVIVVWSQGGWTVRMQRDNQIVREVFRARNLYRAIRDLLPVQA